MTAIAGIVLAAGRARRMGRDKRLAEIDGVPMVVLAVRAALEAGLDPVVVVTGPEPLSVLPPDVVVVVNPAPERGMASSLALGTAALSADSAAAVVLLGDMPRVTASHVAALAAAYAPALGREIVVPVSGGRRGNPVLLGRRFFAEMQGLTGDKGARGLLFQYGDAVVEVEMDESVLIDVDTPEDLKALDGGS